jgi:hypothetical protein
VELIGAPRGSTAMKARLYHLATSAATLALLVQVLDAGRKWG